MKILVCALDWGLGHATRCIPIIQYLIDKQQDVTIASSGKALAILIKNFPELSYLELPAYDITYSEKGSKLWQKIVSQIPKILKTINAERSRIKSWVDEYHFDIIISDNRYGAYHPKCKSIFITHQLQVLTGINSFADRAILLFHKFFLRNFQSIWVVDTPDNKKSFISKLAHVDIAFPNLLYIGYLSQLKYEKKVSDPKTRMNILILLSGPEPMRTILEEKILVQIKNLNQYNFTLIAGKNANPLINNSGIRIIPLADKDNVEYEMNNADFVICRSGYSTIMDLIAIPKKALLIPTPGQTEQEYIAATLQQEKIFLSQNQNELNIDEGIVQGLLYPGFKDLDFKVNDLFQKSVDGLIFLK